MKCPCKKSCERRSATCRLDCKPYLEYAEHKMAEYRTSADSWRRYDDYRLWHDATGHTVTHWMPLPEVPEEGEA